MNTKMKMRMLSFLLCFVMLVGLMPTSVFAAGTKLETPQNLKLQGTVLSWDAVDNADFYGVTLYHPNYVYSIGSWQTDGTSINLYKYLKDGETYGATVIACSNGSYQISNPAEIPLTACTNAGVPIYRDVNVVNGTSSASTAYPGMSVRLEAKPAPDGMVFDRWELSGGYINIGYSDTDTVIYVQAICDNDISARATYKYQENVTSAFTVQPQGGAALVGKSFNVTYAMNFTPQGTVKVQVEGNTPGSFTDLKQGTIDSASVQEDSVVTKTFRIMASDGTRNIYSDEFVVSWEDGPRFISQPMGGTVDHNVDFVATYALNFTPFSCRVERYNDYLGQWSELSFASATQATISSYDFNTSSKYRIKAIIEGGGEVYSDEFTVTWSDAVSKFIQQPVGGTVGFDEDFTFTFAINFTPASNVAIQKYNSGFDSWDTVGYCTSLTSGTISGYASEITNKYRLEAYENGTPIHSNEFTVTWEGTDYTVSFDANGGSGTMAAANGISGNYTLPPNGFTPPANKQFKCWSVNDTDKNPFETISVTANVTVKAVWEDIATTSYTVSFDSNGGSGSMASVTNAPSLYTLPVNGFTPPANKQFKCWAVGAQNDEYDPGDKITITANVTVKAVWEAITSSRQVISDVVATSSDLDTICTLYGLIKIPQFTVTQGAPAYINASTSNLRWQKKVGGVWTNQDSGRFTPGEWRISSSLRIDGTDGYYYELGNPTTLTVNGQAWTVENNGKPSVHPDYSYASIYSPVFTIVDDPNVQPPVSVPSVHMVLKGYEKGALISAAGVQTDAMVDADVLGFLKLVDSNGDGVPEPEVAGNNDVFEEGVLYAVAISLHAKDGYDISGLTPATVSLDRSLMDSVEEFVEDDETFSGIYLLDDINQWTVKFETNGGSSIAPKKVSNGKTVTPPADPTRAYYAFDGWYSDSNLTQAFDFNTPITGDITLYAKWTPSPVGGMFLMTIDLNGGTSLMPLTSEVPANVTMYFTDNLNGQVIPPSGKVLAGYEIDGVPYNPATGHLVTQNFTLKFLWKDAPVTTYTVTFDSNGGTGTMADVTGISGEYTLPANGFTAPAGKQFKAWSVGGVEKAVGDKITVTADTTVTAVWETIPAGHTCDIKPVAKVEPSCTEGGKEAYYKCEGCGKFYEDALGVKEITDLANWGNLPKLGHTESDWKSDKDNHWKECTVAACGVIIENSRAAHADANNDGKCDTCEYNVGTTTTNPNNKPNDNPQTGDNSNMFLWIALLFVSGFGVVATTVIGKKKSSAK